MRTGEDTPAVAVIGVAFELPGCADWESLTALLRHGRDAMRRFPETRAAATGVTRSATDRDGGWLDDITGFDYRYFGLSKAEAELIDPRQRRMLQLACRAIGHAGYAQAELAGTNTAVVVGGYGGPHPSLSDLLPAADRRLGPATTGSLHAYAAGRIAYHLDLRGAAQVVDTACSSFLVALHEARWKIARGECDSALVGGYELVLGALPQHGSDGMGVLSAVDRCRPFDASADGTTYGEGGGFVLLKRLDDALRDGDTVYAVLRGSAVNQDARRGAGLTAPSPQAQTEVITAALRDAGIAAGAIGYVEAHGTGTKIGDPIEIQGLIDAYAGIEGRGPAVSSVKANVGHLGCMAGFAGLVRIIAQFRAEEIFPTAHFEQPNPLLDLASAPLRLADRREPWPSTSPRYAAVSSFGLSGTNAHVIVAAPDSLPDMDVAAPGAQVIVLSARDSAGLRAQVQRLHDQVAADPAGFDLAAAAAVLSVGRAHFAHRHAWLVHDAKELLDRLTDSLAAPPEDRSAPPDPAPVVVALGDPTGVSAEDLLTVATAFPGFADVVTEAESQVAAQDWTPAQRGLVWLLGAHRILTDAGITADLLLSHGAGATAARVLRGDDDLSAALAADPGTPTPPNAETLRTVLAGLTDPVIVDLAPGSALSALLAAEPAATVASTPAHALCQLYLAGHQVDWRRVLGRAPRRRLELPVAPLSEVHCWPTIAEPTAPGGTPTADTSMAAVSGASTTTTSAAPVAPTTASATSIAAAPTPLDSAPVESVADIVLALAREVLKEPEVVSSDDFFDIGGTSLNGAQLVARINERFGTDLGVLDLYDYPDLAGTAAAVAELVGETASTPTDNEATAVPETSIPLTDNAPPPDEGPLSGQQLAIWAADQLDPDTGAYNVPAALLLDGAVDTEALTARLQAVVARHPMLRTRIINSPTGPRQIVTPADETRVTLAETVLELTDHPAAEARPELLDRLRELVAEPLPPDGPPGRYQLVRARFRDGDQQILLLTFHHLFVDGWSWRLLFAELSGEPATLPIPERRYLDYVTDQQALLDGPAGAELTTFWSEYLSGTRYIPLPVDQNAGETSGGTKESALPIDSDRATRLRELARRERCTLHTVLLTAWMTLLGQLTGEQDVCVAVPAAGRKPIDEPVVGNYATTLVVRATVQPEQSITALLTAVRTASLQALDHQDLPTDRLRRIARPNSADPLAATMFTVTSGVEPLRQLGTGGPAVELLDVGQGGAAFPIAVTVLEYGSQLRCRVQYDPTMFRADTIHAWFDSYHALLDRLAALDPNTPVHTLSIGIAPPARQLPATAQGTDTSTATAHVAPNTALQEQLCELWSRYLRRDRVGIEDDFFDLGGDSISAIAIAAEAGTTGIPLRPRAILRLRTVAAVAETIPERETGSVTTAPAPAEVQAHTKVDPTPPQLEFLGRGVPNPDYWNHGVRYTLRRDIDTATVERAVQALADRHPVLHAQLRSVEAKWQLLTTGAPPAITEFDLTAADPVDLELQIHHTATDLHSTLSLSDGPVCRAGMFHTPAGYDDQLVLVIHHTMVDLYSWNVLTEDLSALLAGTSTAELPTPSASYFEWARRLAELVRTRPDTLEAGYWLDRTWGDGMQLRPVTGDSFGIEGNTGELVTEFPAPGPVSGLSRSEHLLAALGVAMQHWLDVRGGEIAVQLVGHGREELFDDLDLGRTVGFFNTTYPFALGLPGRRTPADHAAFVAAQLRSVPGRGFDFEPLRRFHPEAAVRTALDQIPTPDVLFSFWGTPAFLSDERDGALTGADNELVGRDRPADMPRPAAIEVYPRLVADRVRVQWRYSGELFTPERILTLAEAFGAASAVPVTPSHQNTGVAR
ncbi:condensation domain-containing protein [Nocardia suismassiliense]|uniref:condensation domain-containing protein n=1 Tax=Nocardia suismassiliense TaxID=2077092 RepID=UPI000D1F6742|nr:condensation domain-containing protein [Nocardia suismassiliense]